VRWQHLQAMGHATRALAMGATSAVLADPRMWHDRVPPLIIGAAYQNP
jgi:hypothetical protein